MKKQLTPRQIENTLRDMKNESYQVQSTVATLDADSRTVKDNLLVQGFQEMKKDEILALTNEQKIILIFKLLKALVRRDYEPQD